MAQVLEHLLLLQAQQKPFSPIPPVAEKQASADLVEQLLLMFYLQHLRYQPELALFEWVQEMEEVVLLVAEEAGQHPL